MHVRYITVGGRTLRVATSQGRLNSLPLLVFNGIGANLELLRGFADAMGTLGIGIVVFDVPGTGGSEAPRSPYRLKWLANMANETLDCLGIEGQVDVAGVSWGGTIAQEFTHRYPDRVRRLVLAATSAGAVSVPGRVSALLKMLDFRRYADADDMAQIAGELYGGKLRTDPRLLKQYIELLHSPKGAGYYLQLLAIAGWTSAHWLHTLKQPTIVMMGTEDPIVSVINGRLLAKLIPNARLVTIADGHLFLATSTQECAPIIANFLGGPWIIGDSASKAGSAPPRMHTAEGLSPATGRMIPDSR